MRQVLLLCADFVGAHMAGPGIRYWELARHLSGAADVTLAIPNPLDAVATDRPFRVVQYQPRRLPGLLRRSDVLVTQGFRFPLAAIHLARAAVVVDLYDPLPLALLEHVRGLGTRDARLTADYVAARLRHLLEVGDLFLCAGDRQRDFWLGMLTAAGRVNEHTCADDPELRRLVVRVPFGLPPHPPRRTHTTLRGVVPGVQETDRIFLWGGGLWDWLDPLTIIRAMARVAGKRDDVKLVFMGQEHPNPRVLPPRMLSEAIALARSLEIEGRAVIFNPGWVPYERRQDVLLEADVGVTAHPGHLEARFACRSRLLDYLWAGLPVLCARGDELADRVEAHLAGLVLEPGDVAGWAEAILRMADDDALRARCRRGASALAGELTWPRAVAPLVDYCRDPVPARDRRRGRRLSGLAALARYGGSVAWAVVRRRGFGRVRRRLIGW